MTNLKPEMEFDEEAARLEAYRLDDEVTALDGDDFIDTYSFIKGARWQFEQSKSKANDPEVQELVRALEMANEELKRLNMDAPINLTIQTGQVALKTTEVLARWKERGK